MSVPPTALPGFVRAEPVAESRRSRSTLAPEQLSKARTRLSFLTLLFTAMCVAATIIQKTVYYDDPTDITVVFAFNGLTSLILFFIARTKRVADRVVLDVGLVYEVLICLSVSMGFIWDQYYGTNTLPYVTWVCVVMVAYPLVVPSSPARTLLASCAAAAMVPLSLYILHSWEIVVAQPFDYIHVSFSPAFCVALAVLGARVVYGLNVEVSRAQRMGSYQLEALLGRGGMGEVWRAKHRFLARPAAVKLVRGEFQGALSPLDRERLLERFKREAQVTASLESPHTVRLYDFGITTDGVFYYVMELLGGLNLETLVQRYGPLVAERAVHILLQICHSLREAHEQGLVHRDIKPANIILCCRRAGDFDVAKVLDFGLVALRSEAERESAKLTADGIVGGTPAYIAPELATGDRVDARADIYALGCVAYWLVTGRFVFEAENPMKVVLAHLHDQPTSPSNWTELRIPGPFEELIMDCLEKDPHRRPESAEVLAKSLRSTGLSSSWTQERARDWWEIHEPAAGRISELSLH